MCYQYLLSIYLLLKTMTWSYKNTILLFRYHLKALEALSEDLQENGTSLMANLDLVLKWITLRFFDTNPSVILKGLEYLSLVFQYLIDADYTMAEYEANCFIPYLVLKVCCYIFD